MPTLLPENRRKIDALLTEVTDLVDNPNISTKAFKARLDQIEAETAQIEAADVKSKEYRTKFFRGPGEPSTVRTKAGRRWNPASVWDSTEEQMKSLWWAAKHKTGFEFEIGESDGPSIRTKAAFGEGSPGSLLPSVIEPGHTLPLPYEPDRLFEHFVGAPMGSQSITYLEHTGNTNPAAPTAELASKPDLGMNLVPKTVSAQKIAAIASISTEALHDFNVFNQFVPSELGRAIVDAETDYIVNASVTGLIWQTAKTLNRFVGADTPLDALEKAVDDIRVGPAFAVADTMAMHPNTFGYLKRQKNTLGNYILPANPQSGHVDTIWDCAVVQNSKIPPAYVFVFDSSQAILGWTRESMNIAMNPYGTNEWIQNYVTFRAEERIAIGLQRPKALNIVEGFPGSGS